MATETVDTKTGEVLMPLPERALEPHRDIAAVAAAEQARALVEARVILAMRRPRDLDQVRLKLLADCKRTRFAEAARYSKPIGSGQVEGWSIRFAEAAVRRYGNIDIHTNIVSESAEAFILSVSAIDLESNAGFGGEIQIRKTVERRSLRPGEVAESVRTNSQGRPTYTVRATEDDMLTKVGNYISKGIRTYALRLVDADILDECMEQIEKTAGGQTQDPAAKRKRIVDAYAEIGIGPEVVKRIVGKSDLGLLTEAELKKLRETFVALRDEEITLEELVGKAEAEPTTKTTLAERVKAAAKKPPAREPGEDDAA